MSHGSLVLFDQDWNQTNIRYPNGWGMAAAIEAAYKSDRPILDNWLTWSMTLGNNQEEIFERTRNLPVAPRNVLLAVYWQPTLVARKHWPALIQYILGTWGFSDTSPEGVEAFRNHIATLPVVNHWGEIALTLDHRKDDPALVACGFYLTSINEWPFAGPRDPETGDETRPFNGSDSWWFTPGPDPIRAPLTTETP